MYGNNSGYGYGGYSPTDTNDWGIVTYSTAGNTTTVANLWIDPDIRRFAEQVDKFVSESQKRLAQLLEWTRLALKFWRSEHRRPVRAAFPVVCLPARNRICSLAEA